MTDKQKYDRAFYRWARAKAEEEQAAWDALMRARKAWERNPFSWWYRGTNPETKS